MKENIEEEHINILKRAYQLFNARRVEALLALMTNDVHWPNGWEGGYVNGKEEVRLYWTRQWQQLNPTVEPIGFQKMSDARIKVSVHQLVKSLNGEIVFDGVVNHTYRFANGLISEMEIS